MKAWLGRRRRGFRKPWAPVKRAASEARTAHHAPVVRAIWLAVIVFVGGGVGVAVAYGGESFWPGLLGNFGASLAAFVLALAWERARERRQLAAEAEVAQADAERKAEELEERIRTEIRRRLGPVRKELEKTKRA